MKYLLVFTLLYGCSKTLRSGNTSAEYAVDLVGFTSSLVTAEKRFMGYSKAAARVSVIDPGSLKEIAGYTVESNYNFATQLAGFSGIALVADRSGLILSSGQKKTFDLEPHRHLAKAADAAVLSFSNQDGGGFRLIRSKGGGQWQDQTFTKQWSGTKSLVTLLSDDGNKLIALSPTSGDYALYTASSSSADMTGPVISCTGGLDDSVSWSAATYDWKASKLYLGNKEGAIISVKVDAESRCDDFTQVTVFRPTSPSSTLSISQLQSANQLLVAQQNGDLFELTYDPASKKWQSGTKYPKFCNYPLYPLSLSGSKKAFVCLSKVTSSENSDDITYEGASINIFNQDQGSSSLSWPIDFAATAGAAIDRNSATIYVMRESSLGIIDVIDTATSSVKTRSGVFLDKIFN